MAEQGNAPQVSASIIRSERIRTRLERKSNYEEVTSNGTIAAAVMVFAAIAAVIVANSPAYEAVAEFGELWLGLTFGGLSIGMTLERNEGLVLAEFSKNGYD